MEAVPRLPMINFDLKISPDRCSPEFIKLKLYIRDFYNEDPETYSTEIRNLETLRANAVHPARDATGCAVLKKYFCQLHFLQNRFPIGRDEAVAITFAWKDAYGGVVSANADIKFEMVNILYNIGALHSQLGAGDDRSTPEGLKMACTHFQCAAWAFQHLKDSFPQTTGLDISPDLMQFMYQMCLAQAQECILEKSMTDNRKATINAKVAAQIVDYYNLALNALLQGPSDDGSIMDIVGSKIFKTWKKYMKFKVSYYNCISLLYQGMQSEEQQKMGERIAYYQGALDKLNEAIKLSKGLDYGEVVMEALVFTRDVVEGKRKAAKNENDFIYHEDIPDLDTLPIIKGASLVKGIPFSVNDSEISGPDIFARLVPMKAHEVSSLYSEEKAKLLRKMSSMIDSKDEEVVSYMSSLQLDYLKAHLDSGHVLPQEVVDRCAALSAKTDAIPNLISAMDKLSDAYIDVDGMLKEVMELIKIEEISEKEYQEIMGARPPSIVATDLTREGNKYMEAHKKAAESNETLHKAMTQHIENLRVLQQPLDEIASNLPSLDSLNLKDDPTVKDVVILVDKVGEMRKQRAMLASQLRESICSDDITTQLVTRTDERKEDIFEKEMQKHNKYVSLIEQNLAAQENIIAALTDAYAKYAATRKAVTEIMRQREMMLSALISSYDAYEDLITKSTKGLEFYRKLETNLTKLLQRVKGTCKVQQEERDTILAQNNKKLNKATDSSAVSSSTPSEGSGLKLKDFLQNRKAAQAAASSTYYSAQVDGQQSWLPSVRPAPLGSEGTSTTNQVDYSPSTYISSGYGAYNQAAYGTDYAKNYMMSYNYQNPLSVDLQNLQYPSISASGAAVNPMSSPSPKQYNSQLPTNPYMYSQNSGTSYSNYDPSNPVPAQYSGQVASQYTSAQSGQQGTLSTATNPTLQLQYSSNPYQYHQAAQNYQNPSAAQKYTSTGTSQNYQVNDSSNYQTSVSQAYQNSVSQNYQSPSAQAYQTPQVQSYQNPSAQSYQQTPSTQSYQTPSTQSYQTPSTQNYQQTPSTQSYQSPSTQSYQTPSTQSYQTPSTQSYSTPSTQSYPTQSDQSYQTASTQGYNTATAQTYPIATTQSYQTPTTQSYLTQPTQAYQTSVNQNYQDPSSQNYQNPSLQQGTGTPAVSNQQYSVGTPQNTYENSNVSGVYGSTSQQHNSGYQTNIPYSNYTGTYQYSNQTQWPQEGYPYNANDGSYNATHTSANQSYSGASPQTAVSYGTNQAANSITNPSTSNTSTYNNTAANLDYSKTIPTTLSSVDYAKYYSDYSNTYPNVQFQGTPGTDTSHYSNAGGRNTSETNSSSVTPEGLTYASQYVATTVAPEYLSYYHSPYGYQYSNPTDDKPTTVAPQQAVNHPNSLTYMNSSHNGMTMTYSQQQNGTTPPAQVTKQPSNLDLLTGLDFTVTDTQPLQPLQKDTKVIDQAQEKMASLSIEPKPAPPSREASSNELDNKTKQSSQNGSTSSLDNIERPSPSKTPLKDPFSDPEVLSQFVQEVEKFEKFVEGLNSKTLNGPTPLDIKWSELQDLQDKDAHRQIISVARCYPMKNRFSDFLPYDSSRVELPSTKDDYINASHLQDFRPYTPNFIMTQAPLPATYADFWTMVIEQHIEIIICLLTDSQMNGEIYWAVNKTEDLIIGKIKVSLQSMNAKPNWIERIMSVSDGKISRVVVHLQFISWPHSWMPESPAPFLSLVKEAVSVWNQQRGRGPMVVHCDSGVGKSGLFVLLTLASADLGVTPHLPDPISLAGQIAGARKNPLRDRAHLAFAYHCILYHARDLLMKMYSAFSLNSDMHLRKTRSGTRALQEIEANASPVGSTGSSETLVGTPEENKVQEEFPSPDLQTAPSTRKVVPIPDDPIDMGSSGLDSYLDRTDEFSYESGKIPLPQSTQQSTPRVSFNQALFEQIKAQNVRPVNIVVGEIPGQSGNPIGDSNPLQVDADQRGAYPLQRSNLIIGGILASRSTFEEKRPKTKSHTRHPSEDFLLNSLNKEHNEERRPSDASSTGSGNKPCSESDPLSQLDPLWQIKRLS